MHAFDRERRKAGSPLYGTKLSNYDTLNELPEREWRLLQALVKKREKEEERLELSVEFQKLWNKEREDWKMLQAASTQQWRQYLVRKRRNERALSEHRQRMLEAEQQSKVGRLQQSIDMKEWSAAQIQAYYQRIKLNSIADKSREEEVRAGMAADRRKLLTAADETKNRAKVYEKLRKLDRANEIRAAIVRDTAKRATITNTLNALECSLITQEKEVLDAAKRASHAAHAALTDARADSVLRARELQAQRARRIAAFTKQLRQELCCRDSLYRS